MCPAARGMIVVFAVVVWTALEGPVACGEVTDITGSSSATVIEFIGFFPVQTDVAQVIVPLTAPTPPAVSRARLDRLADDGDTTASGQAVALFDLPDLNGVGLPNDVGLDLGAFSDNDFTSWFVRGTANETRTIVLESEEVGGDLIVGMPTRTRGRVVLSGVLVVTASDAAKDLSGVEASIQIHVTRLSVGQLRATLLEGEVALTGGPNGSVTVARATGAFEGMFLPVVDFADTVPDFPLVQAVLFTGLELPFEYDIDIGQPFELNLSVTSQLLSTPGGTGAAAVFGLPQEGLGSILQRIKKDDRGRQLAAMIAQHVDTTGAAYAEGGSLAGLPAVSLFPLCGAMGFCEIGVMLTGCFLISAKRRRRRRVPRAVAVGQLGRR